MSRIQHILDKAERDGAVRRVRPSTALGTSPSTALGTGPSTALGTGPSTSLEAGGVGGDGMSSSAGARVAMPIEQQPRSIDGAPMPSAFAGEPSAPLLAPAVRAFDVSGGPMLPPDLDDFGSAAILGSDAAADVHLDDAVRVIPTTTLDRRLVAAGSESTAAEQYRALRTRILHADNGTAVNILLVTSPGRAEGKTITAGNLALTMAQEFQRRICLVDADLRHPQIQTLFGLPEGPGLSDVLAGRATLEQALVTIEDLRITLLPAGRAAHPAELLGTTAMRRTIDTLRTRFDRVVVDAPAAAPLADVGILTPLVDSVLLVVRSAVTSKPAIHDAVASIDAGKLLGVVLNDASAS